MDRILRILFLVTFIFPGYKYTFAQLTVSITPDEPVVCFGDATVSITAKPSSGTEPYNYLWSDGKTAKSVSVGTGQFWVRVTDNIGAIAYDTVDITAQTAPITVDAGPDQTLCADSPIVELKGVVTVADGGTWFNPLGNGTFNPGTDFLETTYIPTEDEVSNGFWDFTLVTTGNANCPSKSDVVRITYSPVSEASFEIRGNCNGQPITFENKSTYDSIVTAWTWDFGDGTFDNSKSPEHLYTDTGSYQVMLKTSTSFGCADSITRTVYVNPTPTAGFNSTNLCLGDTLILKDGSTISGGTINSWEWDFGDGNTSITREPEHVYTIDSTYNISLVVTSDSNCTDTLMANIVVSPAPEADFTVNDTCYTDTVKFTDLSSIRTESIATWEWDFGDGNTSTIQNPAHVYATAGPYNVRLVVSPASGCPDTVIKKFNFFPKPVADFTFNNLCEKQSTVFSDQSTVSSGSISKWFWDFNDQSNTSNAQNPSYEFNTDNAYDVLLVVTSDGFCLDSAVNTVTIKPSPIADFTISETCLDDTVMFTDNSSLTGDNIISWSWDLDNGDTSASQNTSMLFNNTGSYNISLVVESSLGCSDSVAKSINIHPVPIAGFEFKEACDGENTIFTDTSFISSGAIASYQWDLGDTQSSTAKNPTYKYSKPGSYNVKLTVISDSMCIDSALAKITVHPVPEADFSSTAACYVDSIFFTDETRIDNDSIVSWTWDLGDNTKSTIQDPARLYASDGQYNVSLKVSTAFGCTDSVEKQIDVYPAPLAEFSFQESCQGDSTRFTDLSKSLTVNDSILSWEWDFGDNSTATILDPVHLYQTADTFGVKLIVVAASGCSDTLIQPVVAHPIPIVDLNAPNVCHRDTTQFTDASSINSGTIDKWTWNFGDEVQSSVTDPVHSYSDTGSFTVTLTVQSDFGCIDSTVKEVRVYALPKADFNFLGGCINEPVKFSDLSTSNGDTITSWSWSFGDGNFSTLQDPENQYASSAGYVASLTVTTKNQCSDSIAKAVVVNPPPVADFTQNKIKVMPYESVMFTDQSTDGVDWQWDFGDGEGSSSLDNPSYSYKDTGTYDIMMIVFNALGCSDTAYGKIISVLPPSVPSAFSPNGDGVNDILYVKGGPYRQIEINIYNEWGEMIFISRNQGKGWDGKKDGVRQPVGVYVYTLRATTLDNKTFEESGDITLVR